MAENLVYRDNGTYVFTDPKNPGFTYEITDELCKSPSRAIGWIAHMGGKSWVTDQHLRQFAELAAEHFGGAWQ